MSLSRADVRKLRQVLMEAIERICGIADPSEAATTKIGLNFKATSNLADPKTVD